MVTCTWGAKLDTTSLSSWNLRFLLRSLCHLFVLLSDRATCSFSFSSLDSYTASPVLAVPGFQCASWSTLQHCMERTQQTPGGLCVFRSLSKHSLCFTQSTEWPGVGVLTWKREAAEHMYVCELYDAIWCYMMLYVYTKITELYQTMLACTGHQDMACLASVLSVGPGSLAAWAFWAFRLNELSASERAAIHG